MTPRATAMSPDDRRKAIVAALLPLLVERGEDVSTREIAQAAGIAEGTIFRVFPDKGSLMLAAAEEAINPADGQAAFDEAMARPSSLREQVVVAAAAGARPDADDDVGDDAPSARHLGAVDEPHQARQRSTSGRRSSSSTRRPSCTAG